MIFRALPAYDGDKHYGSRLAFGPDGMLYVTLGERSDKPMRPQAQQLDSHMGKIIRIRPDGSVPATIRSSARPARCRRSGRSAIATCRPRPSIPRAGSGTIEHGTRGGDELNLIEKGKNYGWPVQAYGDEYSGAPIAGAATAREGMEQPVYYWDPVIAPSGAQFYTGDAFPAWRSNSSSGAEGHEAGAADAGERR